MKDTTQKITPCIWFDSEGEEAANYYVSIFKNSRILNTTRYDKSSSEASGRPEGSVLTVVFELEGQKFMALNGGPVFKFTEAISLMVNCETQDEIDHCWNKLTEGGEAGQCGWLKDKYGLSWQIVPSMLGELLQAKEAKRAQRVMSALLKMKKLDIAELRRAFEAE